MNAHGLRVRDRFDGEAKNWDAQYRHPASQSIYTHNLMRRQQQTRTLIGKTDARLLELGCGAGNVLLAATEHAASKPFGADFSLGMLKQARHNAQKQRRVLPLLATDACHLPFTPNSFGAILCLGVLEYISDYTKVIQECYRVLKPGGEIIVSVPNAHSPFIRTDDMIFGLKNRITRGLLPQNIRTWIKTHVIGRPEKPYFNHKKQRFSPENFTGELIQAGFCISNQHYHTFGFGLFEGQTWNVQLSEYIEKRAAHHPKLEKWGWTYILKAVKS